MFAPGSRHGNYFEIKKFVDGNHDNRHGRNLSCRSLSEARFDLNFANILSWAVTLPTIFNVECKYPIMGCYSSHDINNLHVFSHKANLKSSEHYYNM